MIKNYFILAILSLPLFGDSINQRFSHSKIPYQFESNHLTLVNTKNLTLHEAGDIENIDTNFQEDYKLYGLSYQEYSYHPTSTMTIGYFDKAESFIEANKGFIRGSYIVTNTNDGLAIQPNKIFDIKADGLYYKSHGLYIEEKIANFIFKISTHNLKELQQINIDGYGYDETQGIRTDIFIDYFYSNKNYLLKNEKYSRGRALKSNGYSLDISYQNSFNNWDYGFGRDNIISNIYVKNHPSLYATLSNIDRLYTSTDGFKQSAALLNGKYIYRDLRFKLPKTDFLYLENQHNYGFVWYKIESELENFYIYKYVTQNIKFGYSKLDKLYDFEYFGKNYSFNLSYNFRDINNYNGVNLGFKYRY